MKKQLLIGVISIGITIYHLYWGNVLPDGSEQGNRRRQAITSEGGIKNTSRPPVAAATIKSKIPPRQMIMTATAYNERGITKSGVPAGPGRVAVDPKVIPLGTRLHIEGYGFAVAMDTGRLIKGRRLDVWYPSRGQAIRYGRRTVRVTVYK